MISTLDADPELQLDTVLVAPTPNTLKVFVLRHADRADDHEASPEVQDIVDVVWDTPLAPVGFTTVQKVIGRFVQAPFDAIVCSPMLRCVQTASAARELTSTTAPVTLDTGLIEVWNDKVLKNPFAESHLRTLEELEAKIPSAVIEYPSTLSKPTVSETRGIGGSADTRFRDAFVRLVNESVQKGHKSLLLCSHGDCIGSVVSLIFEGRKSIYSVEYCGLLVIEYDINSRTFTLDIKNSTYGVGIMDE
jgi:broad specificity phosphatase PhoE